MTSLYVKLEGIEISNAHETIRPSGIFDDERPGTMVAVRPWCDAPTGVIGEQVGDKIVLRLSDYCNPAIYIPALNEIVWGYGSWWGEIKSEEHLHQITDADIENVWYVRALKQLSRTEDNAPA